MLATLEFKLPDEREEYELAMSAGKLSSVLYDFDQYLRGRLKYEELDQATYTVLDATRSKLWEICNQHEVTF